MDEGPGGADRNGGPAGIQLQRGTCVAGADIPSEDRWEQWCAEVHANHGREIVISCNDVDDFWGQTRVNRLSTFDIGDPQAIRFRSAAINYHRRACAAEKDQDGSPRLVVVHAGQIRLGQYEERETVGPGRVGLLSWAEHAQLQQDAGTDADIVTIPANVLPPALRYRPPLLLPDTAITGSLVDVTKRLTGHPEITARQFLFLAQEINRMVGGLLDEQQVPELDELARLAADARQVVETHYWDADLSVARLADRLNIPKRRLEYALETTPTRIRLTDSIEELVTGPGGLIRAIRLAHAHQRLAAGSTTTVSDIAAACGFGALSSFHEAFRTAFGVSPGHVKRAAATRLPQD